MSTKPTPPKALIIPELMEIHGHERTDNYFWMNQLEDPKVIDYLEQENAYYQACTAHTKDLQEELFQEMKARIKEEDSSVPYFYKGYWYITRFELGQDYPIHSRKKESLDATEEILFNVNEMAKGHSYYKLNGIAISPNNRMAAFCVDTVGRRKYTIYFKDLQTGEILADRIENCVNNCVWANDNFTLFYTRQHDTTLRADRIFKHRLGANSQEDELVYFEADDTFNVFVSKEKSQAYLTIGSSSTMTTEFQVLDANTPDGQWEMFSPRERGIEYHIAHFEQQWYVMTNADDAFNFKLMTAMVGATYRSNWQELIPHREEVLLEGFDLFSNYLVIEERNNGLAQINIRPWEGQAYYLPFGSETYTAYTTSNVDFDTEILRYGYQSMNTPASIIDFNMRTFEKEIKKEQEVLGGEFDKENYIEQRIWATAADGVQIPMSVVYRKGLLLDGSNPCLQYAYGSYGHSMDPYFSSTRLSLLDRGFVYVIAHVRGGEDLGRQWYENGKLLHKRNTFTDFIACSEHLIAQGYTSADRLYAEGGSAGGLLMGVIANEAPELYHGIIAQVPFVDVLTTMLDDEIPLTTGEYDEWGNPNESTFYEYMASYSPYDNVKLQAYPNLYISTGIHDSQVQYWEPAKWIAKLRVYNTSDNLLFLDTNMDAGHSGASGRFESLRELAKEFAFLLDLEKNR